MWIAGLIVLGVVLAAGVWLTITGLRGRVVDDHPVCRKCKFDLSGIYPGEERCPECGAELNGETVRFGQRARRTIRAATGALILGAALIVVPVMLVTMTGTVNWNSYMPTSVLIWQSQAGTPTAVNGAVQELTTRFNAGTLKKKQIDRVISAGLEAQNDTTRPWDQLWGDLIEDADSKGYLSEENRDTYLEQIVTTSVKIQQRVHPDKEIAIGLEVAPGRSGAKTKYGIAYTIDSVRINGKPGMTGKVSGFSDWTIFSFGGRVSGTMQQVVKLEPGINEIETTWRISFMEPSNAGFGRGKTIYEWTGVDLGQTTLVPEDEPLVEWVNDVDLAQECRKRFTIELMPARFPIDGHSFYDLKIISQDQSIALAMDIIFIANDQETRIGTLTVPPEHGSFGKSYSKAIDSFASAGRIILRPSEDALLTLNVDRALGVELSFPVELKAGDDIDD